MIREDMSLSREIRTIIMKSIGHSACLPDLLTFLSYSYKIDHRSEDVFTSNEINFFNIFLIYV
ncbi:hypothetical protein NC653_016744 [Populus alba x Populus x berolinensis]|uniref:Uncharacterized protein n=1 Tax=Populus alba x Populus x berolinensis TaxID=444605 RepID=A0AAD6QNL2_9ROSI|nr:hypothetical protein NC653_016744 [Populus alba x Populus x berolinensis]